MKTLLANANYFIVRPERLIAVLALALFSCGLPTGCSLRDDSSTLSEVQEFSLPVPSSIHSDLNLIFSNQKLAVFGDSACVYFYDPGSGKIFFQEIHSGKGFRSMAFATEKNVLAPEDARIDLLWIEPEKILVFSEKNQTVSLIRISRETNEEPAILEKVSLTNWKDEAMKSCWCQSYLNSCFRYCNGRLYFQVAYTDLFLHDKHSFVEYFSRKSQFSIRLSDSLQEPRLLLDFPYSYRKGDYKGEFNSFRTVAGNRILFSFPFSDSVYLFKDDGSYSKALFSSRYCKGFPTFDPGKTMDFAYQLKFRIENPCYEDLVFDEYNQRFYRAFKKPMSYLNAKGTIRKETEIEWTLIVADSNFNILGEIGIDPVKYSLYRVVPSARGLYLMHPVDSCISRRSIRYSLVKISTP